MVLVSNQRHTHTYAYFPLRFGPNEDWRRIDTAERLKRAPAEGLLPFDQINLAKIDNEKMFLRVSLGGYIKREQKRVEKPIPIVILDYDHVLNPDTGDYADGIPAELRDEIESLKQSTYCEFSKSGAGIHAFCIDNLPEPVTKPDGKPFLKIKADSKPEIFRGDGQVLCTGWRIPAAV